MTSILDMPEPTTDRELCVICAERPRALTRVARCWPCIKAVVDRDRLDRNATTACPEKEVSAS